MLKINNHEVNTTIFPDKTSQVWKLPESVFTDSVYNITWIFENEAEIFHLCQLVQLLKHKSIPKKLTLYMPYLPYGRQDKEISNESTFSLRTFSKIINSLCFDLVTTVDAHSDLGYEIINNFESKFISKEVSFAYNNTMSNLLVYPDAGACYRYEKEFPVDYIIGHKTRDQLTGYITDYKLDGNPKNDTVLIVDDLCDGGMTFILLAKELLKQGAREVNLYVSHGIFSKGIQVLKDAGINRIFTRQGEVK